MLRRLFALVVLVALVGVAVHLWREQGRSFGGSGAGRMATDRLGDVSRTLQDKKTTISVKTAMSLSRTLHALPIDVESAGGVVTLRGRTVSSAQRAAAEEMARSVPDVETVHNELQVDPSLGGAQDSSGRTLGESLDDRALEAKVKLAWSLHRGMEDSDVDVRSFRRSLTLSGEATSPAQKQLAHRLAADVPDATSVTDQIAVRGGAPVAASTTAAPVGAPSATRDVERALAQNPNLAPYALRVLEREGVIRIEGRVATAAEKDLAGYVATAAAHGAAVDNAVQARTGAPSH